ALWALAVRPAQRALEAALADLDADAAGIRSAWLGAFDALCGEAARLLSRPLVDGAGARARYAERWQRFQALAGPARDFPAERAASEAWLLLEGCGGAFARGADTSTAALEGVRLFDELSMREAIARALRDRGAEGERAWRLAARVRALLAHPRAGSATATREEWQALLADDDARYAGELGEDTPHARAPAWLMLPSRLEGEAV